ncbi:Pentatricopeptide repeat-containing protein [Acorus gramineus]|uniref:Pentatricopeptide repeat-containing protein n=1 Tax=Acorus gramineus TaxID=55184 RepID=A0AAV9ARR6_ACOGR|nr:Pentatricopeptide repeat-containing protein [Acorus gramineus]
MLVSAGELSTSATIPLGLRLSIFHHKRNPRHHHHHLPTPTNPLLRRLEIRASPPWTTSARATQTQTPSLEEEEGESDRSPFERDDDDDDGEDEALRDAKAFDSPHYEVKELSELPEQWRRAKVAWLCKEVPSHRQATLLRLLNAQRKWVTQEDLSYVAVHCMRIRENEAGFRVYKWMSQQHWFQFDFALATRLADYLGKDRKFSKCREIFDEIVNRERVPSESTFHILIVAYLSAPIEGCVEEACTMYNRMIQIGGYSPRLSLHNSLFRALLRKPGGGSKHYLKQAEFIFHNLVTTNLEIQKDIYSGLIWLHSYQDVIDRGRITELREEMKQRGVEESVDVLLSVLRACSKEGDVEEAEITWLKLLDTGYSLPSQAFVYRMEVYAKIGEPMKSLEIFKGMQEAGIPTSVVAYHKIIELMSKAQELKITEALMDEFIGSGKKPLMPSYIDLMNMYFSLGLHDRLESTFSECISRCRPNRTIYNIYMDSLIRVGNLEKAEQIFNEMITGGTVSTNARSCNIILGGYLTSKEFLKAEKIYDMMHQKKYDIDPQLLDEIEYILSLNKKMMKKPVKLKLDEEQREILMGLLLGGVRIESDEQKKIHAVFFEFREGSDVHSVLKTHIHERYHEWLTSFCMLRDGNDEVPYRFSTVAHSNFGIFADQFYRSGRPSIPKLIHRWLSPRVLAYWYMQGGLRTSSGDIVLKLKGGSQEDLERVVRTFQMRSLNCKVKRKGRISWIGFQEEAANRIWELMEPYVLEDLKDVLKPEGQKMVLEEKLNDSIQLNHVE